MKKYYLLLLFVTSFMSGQIVNIPDANFKAKLLSASSTNSVAYSNGVKVKIDLNNDNEIQISEAIVVDSLNVFASSISNLQGVISFSNLKSLSCGNNNITSINLNGLDFLEYLNFINNQVSNLDVSELTNLKKLNCRGNQITSINASGLTSLEYLKCSNNNDLSSLNLNGCISLEYLECHWTELTTLNISGLIGLKYLYCNNAQIFNINRTGTNSLLEINLGDNNLSTLDLTNLTELKNLILYNNNISSLLGLTTCVSLIDFDCAGNQLTNLDLSALNDLLYLNCGDNLLQNLIVANSEDMIVLHCDNNQLISLTLGNMPVIQKLTFSNNFLTSIDVSSYITLLELQAGQNALTTLNVSSLVNLTQLYCYNNQLNSLEVENLLNLTKIICYGNQLTSLNLNNCNYLQEVYCNGNQLNSLFIKNGINETTLNISQNPALQFICADESQLNSIESQLLSLGMTSTIASSYCSFSPGGIFNTITGSMLFDENNNGCDASDLQQPNIKISINDGTNQGDTFTSTYGNFSFFTQTGSFDITPSVENPSWFNFSPTTATIPFVNNDNNVVTQNFCITPNGIHPDLEVVLVPIIPARPGFDAIYKIVYKNKGNQTVNGIVFFGFNYAYMDFVSAVPTQNSSSAGYYGFNFTDLTPFETRSILVTLNINAPTETNAVNIGDILELDASVILTSGSTSETETDDNIFYLNQTVVGSYDPNDITCLQGNALPTTEMGEFLHYNIRFENTGTYAAENIVVKNEIDLTQYNIQSLQVMESSHPVTIKVTGNIAEFIFQGIDLDTGGHGNILLKLKSNTTLSNDLVINSAEIFFDYNFPIITNDEQTVFADLSKNDFVKDSSIQVYPNPTNNIINVKADNTINSIQLYDVQGRLLLTKMGNDNSNIIDLSSYNSGIYFINISTTMGKQTQKIIKN